MTAIVQNIALASTVSFSLRCFPGTAPLVACDLEAVMTYQRKLWLGVLAIGVAITAMPNDGPDSFLGFAGSVSQVPLPGALPLFAMGLAGLGLLSWRRRKRAQV
jgi:hypothetical protein